MEGPRHAWARAVAQYPAKDRKTLVKQILKKAEASAAGGGPRTRGARCWAPGPSSLMPAVAQPQAIYCDDSSATAAAVTKVLEVGLLLGAAPGLEAHLRGCLGADIRAFRAVAVALPPRSSWQQGGQHAAAYRHDRPRPVPVSCHGQPKPSCTLFEPRARARLRLTSTRTACLGADIRAFRAVAVALPPRSSWQQGGQHAAVYRHDRPRPVPVSCHRQPKPFPSYGDGP